MNSIMHTIMLSCKKAAALVEKKQSDHLSWVEDMQLRMHSSMCNACTAYAKQSKFIDSVLNKQLWSGPDENITPKENPELKKKIISKL